MFGFLKRFGKKNEPEIAAVPPPAPTSGHSVVPDVSLAGPAGKTVMPLTSSRPVPRQDSPSETVAEEVLSSAPVAIETIDIPFRSLFNRLHPSVQAMPHTMPAGDASFCLPLSIVQEQLPKGAVKIRLAQLREFSPAGVFQANPAADGQEIDLPISEIVPRIKPGQLSRRANQRQCEVPEDIAPVFGPNGAPAGSVRIVEARARTAAEKMVQKPAEKVAEPARVAPSPVPGPVPAPVEAPYASPVAAVPPAPEKKPAPPVQPILPAPVIEDRPVIRAPGLDPSLASLKPSDSTNKFIVPLMDMASYWAANGKNELSGLYRHTLEIPVERVEQGLKRGRLAFTWPEVRTWIRLAPGTTLETLPDDLEVELPLQIIAPRFMERRTAGNAQKRVEVSRDIPDLFASRQETTLPENQSPEAAISAEAGNAVAAFPLPKPPEPVVHSSSNGAPRSGNTDDLAASERLREYGEIFGNEGKTQWNLNEVVQKCAALPGVAGAIITTADGLLVSGIWPDEIKTESVAGFIPQMFSRMTQYTEELKLGNPRNVTLLVENLPLQIFKLSQMYFAVLGRAGEPLPKSALSAVATRLAQPSNNT